MTTKKDAAARVLYVANLMRDSLAGDREADLWIALLEAVAYDLDVPTYSRLVEFKDGPTLKVKLRSLIDPLRRELVEGAIAELDKSLVALGGFDLCVY